MHTASVRVTTRLACSIRAMILVTMCTKHRMCAIVSHHAYDRGRDIFVEEREV